MIFNIYFDYILMAEVKKKFKYKKKKPIFYLENEN